MIKNLCFFGVRRLVCAWESGDTSPHSKMMRLLAVSPVISTAGCMRPGSVAGLRRLCPARLSMTA